MKRLDLGIGILICLLLSPTAFGWVLRTQQGKNLEADAVTAEELQRLFKILATDKSIEFKFIDQGCEARAEKMALILEQKGLKSVKVFATGDLEVGKIPWDSHVAPVLYQITAKGKTAMVLDPSIFNEPVPISEWLKKISKKGGHTKVFFTNRFQYDSEDLPKSTWDPEDLANMNTGLGNMLIWQKIREKDRKDSSKPANGDDQTDISGK